MLGKWIHTWDKCVTCCEFLLSLKSPCLINPRDWQDLHWRAVFHFYLPTNTCTYLPPCNFNIVTSYWHFLSAQLLLLHFVLLKKPKKDSWRKDIEVTASSLTLVIRKRDDAVSPDADPKMTTLVIIKPDLPALLALSVAIVIQLHYLQLYSWCY